MNEWGFASEISKWWSAAAQENPALGVSDSYVEQTAPDDQRRADLTAYDHENRPLIVIELRLPDHANPSPFDMNNLRDAIGKAQRVNARWAATSDGQSFLLADTHIEGTIPSMLKAPLDLRTPASREALDVPAKRDEIKFAWQELLERISLILKGDVEPATSTPDEMFIEAIRALLRAPVASVRDTLSVRKDGDQEFRDQLIRWMVDQQGWTHEAAKFEDEVQRVANVSAYVFTTRLLFYEALRRAQPSVTKLEIPAGVLPAQATVKALFDHAREVSGDYETVFVFDRVCQYALISDEAVTGWRRVVDHLVQFELDAISYDVLGRLFERLIDPQERYEWGQHYTEPDVVDLMLSMASPDGEGLILDPASGGGTFLVRGYARKRVLQPEKTHQELLSELAGADQSAFAASISTISLASRDLSLADNYPRMRASSFFKLHPGAPWMQLPKTATTNVGEQSEDGTVVLPEVAAVVCNPPYIGYNNIGDRRRVEADEALRQYTGTPNSLKQRYNYHLYFWFHAAAFLKKHGRLVFITSGEWLDSDYGVQLQEWLLRNAHIELVMESLAEAWFSEARVGTVVVSARLRSQDIPVTF